MNRIDRLSAILVMLQSSTSVNPHKIAERFDISIRTVYRDIRALEETNIPIAGDSRSGYSLVDGFKLPPLMFSQEEAFAFVAAEKIIEKYTDKGLWNNYKLGVEKIRAVMPLIGKTSMAAIDNKIGHLDFYKTTENTLQNRIQLLLNLITKQEKIEIDYQHPNKESQDNRLLDPIGIFFSLNNWYLVSFCNTKNDYRTFRVSRIANIKATGQKIDKTHPPLDYFLVDKRNKEDLKEVIIETTQQGLSLIGDSRYYQGLVSENTENDCIKLHFMTFSLTNIARWYLSFMDIAQIVYPEDLKQIVDDIICNHRKEK